MKILLAVTTYNQLNYTKKFLKTLDKVDIPNMNIIFIDDVSTDGTQKFLKESKYCFIERKVPKGLTLSWNIAYRKFKDENYDVLILANNDVLVTKTAIVNLIKATKSHSLVCPITTKKGADHNWQSQSIHKYYPALSKLSQQPKQYKETQKKIKYKCKKMGRFNGFFFAISRSIIKYAFDKDNLFNPKNTNVHQEGDLSKRMKGKEFPVVCLGSFVFHFKGVSFKKKVRKGKGDIRQHLSVWHK